MNSGHRSKLKVVLALLCSFVIQHNVNLLSVDGTCFGLNAADVVIETVASTCSSGIAPDSMVGFRSPRSTVIMEVQLTNDINGTTNLFHLNNLESLVQL